MLTTTYRPYHLYIHAPWCKRLCPYCDFTVYVDKEPPFEQWKNKILLDHQWHLDLQIFPLKGPKTLYFGGGTPSLLPIPILQELIEAFSTPETKEITIEVNPGDITPERLSLYKKMGVTRLSLGIQSFNRKHLRRLGRNATPKDVHQLITWVNEANFDSWSMDLMFGLPDQTMDEFTSDVQTMLSYQPPHLSLYGLTYKEGTPFWNALKQGKLLTIPEDEWIVQFDYITEVLKQSGYLRYEVSNFCRPPHQARHNEGIWKNEHYIGLGPGAHGFLPNGQRSLYPREWKEWQTQVSPSLESPNAEQAIIDWLITAIRHHEGISLEKLNKMGFTLDLNSSMLSKNIIHLLEISPNSIRLSTKGWIMVDWITEVIVDCIHPIGIPHES